MSVPLINNSKWVFFGEIEIKNIVDMTEIPDYATEKYSNQMLLQIDEDFFRQIIKLELPINSKENVLDVIKQLEQVEGIVYAGPNYCYSALDGTESYEGVSTEEEHNLGWNLEKIQIEEAWNITTGSANVRVGVIDTGIYPHSNLNANLVEGWDFVNDNEITTDVVKSHGTSVAGVIGATIDESDGLSGVIPNVSIVPLQVSKSDGAIDSVALVRAITYAMNSNIPIVNYSIGSETNDYALMQAIANYPGLLVCSAGNEGKNNDEIPRYPTSFGLKNVISVASSTSADTIYAGDAPSNYGVNTVHLAAPGEDILTTFAYGAKTIAYGTSLAAPHVTGVAALILSIRPDLTAVEVKNLILNNVDEVSALSDKCITGGRLNAYKAVRAATAPQTFSADVNDDGYCDMILSRNINGKRAFTTFLGNENGSFGRPIITESTYDFSYTEPAFAGDFNGDGFTDIIILWSSNNMRQLLVYISRGNGTFREGYNLSSTRVHDPVQFPSQYFVEDVNGDGRDDFVVHYRNSSGKRCALVYRGTNQRPYILDATTDALVSNNTYYHNDPVFMGDFNGDGCADMLVHWVGEYSLRQLLVYTGKPDGTFNSGANMSGWFDHSPGFIPTQFFVADESGDGKDDFIVHYKNHLGNRCNIVYEGIASAPYVNDTMDNALTSTDTYVETDPVFVGDVNGDDRSDMIVHWVSGGYRQFLIYPGNPYGTYGSPIRCSTNDLHDPNERAESFYVADVDGDGRDDFIVKWKNGTNTEFLTYRGTAGGSFSAAVRSIPSSPVPYYNEN